MFRVCAGRSATAFRQARGAGAPAGRRRPFRAARPGAGDRASVTAYRLSASPLLRKSEINRLRETHPGRPGKAGVRGRVPVGSRLTKKLQ